MSANLLGEGSSPFDEVGEALLQDLERQKLSSIRSLRAHDRIDVELPVKMEPANSSDWPRAALQGVTQDLSRGGCRVICDHPPGIGDVYRLVFDASTGIPMVFARCQHGRLLREDAFEAGFHFFTEIELLGVQSTDRDLLA